MDRSFVVSTIIIIVFMLILLFSFWMLSKKQSKKSVDGKHVCITGGSKGTGLCIAINAAKAGADVTIVARNINDLETAVHEIKKNCLRADQKIEFFPLDLTKSQDVIHKAFEEIEKKSGEIYMLVNNAGMAVCGTIDQMKSNDAKWLMDLNFFGTLFPIQYVLPKMKAKRDGIIVLTASQAGLLGIFGLGVYSATKFALRGLAEALYMETKHLGINVCLALPADVDTPGLAREKESKPIETSEICGQGSLFQPESVAKRIFEDALSGNFFSIQGLQSWLLSLICVGMAPWKNPLLCILQIIAMGPCRLIGIIAQWNFARIVKKHHHDHKK